MLSGRERALYEERSAETTDRLVQLNTSLNAILQSFVGKNKNLGQMRMFQLACKSREASAFYLYCAT
jgi:hypothetical protein